MARKAKKLETSASAALVQQSIPTGEAVPPVSNVVRLVAKDALSDSQVLEKAASIFEAMGSLDDATRELAIAFIGNRVTAAQINLIAVRYAKHDRLKQFISLFKSVCKALMNHDSQKGAPNYKTLKVGRGKHQGEIQEDFQPKAGSPRRKMTADKLAKKVRAFALNLPKEECEAFQALIARQFADIAAGAVK